MASKSKKTEAQIEFKAVTSEFSSGIKDMNSDIKTLTNELKLNSTQLKGNADDVDLLKQRQNLLQQELEASSQKVELTSKSLEEAERLLGKNSTEYKNLYNSLLNAKNQEQAIKNEIDTTNNKLKQQETSLDQVDTAIDNVNDGFTVSKGVMADLASKGIQTVISGVGNMVSSLYDSVEATEEYRSMMSKLEGSTESFGYSTDFSREKFDTFYRYLGDNQMATNAVTNLMGLQTSQESLTSLTDAAIGVWSAYGDSIPIESLTESMNETAQVGQVTGVLADALNWAGISEDDFNSKLANTNSTQERAEMIADTLNGVYGESKNKYDELSGSLLNANDAQNELQQSQANLAESISPLKDRMTELKAQGFEAIKPLVEGVVNGLLGFSNWITQNTGTIQTIGIILGSLATAILLVNGAVGAYNIIMPIYKAVTTGASISTTALGTAVSFLTSPITIAVAIIGGLIAVGVLLWQNWDTVKQKAGELKDWVVEKFTALKDGVVNLFNNIKEKVTNAFNNLKNGIVNIATNIKNGIVDRFNTLKNGVVNTVTNIKNGIVDRFNTLKTGAINIVTNIKNGIVDKFNSAKNTVLGIFDNIKNGIKDKIEWAKDRVSGIVDKIKGFFNFDFKLPDIKTPHFSITPSGWKIGDLLDGVIPKLGIEWRKDGAIFTKPTLFNSNRGIQGVGEAGAEAVLPINLLESYINNAFYNSAMQAQMYNAEQTNRIVQALEKLENMNIYMDTYKVGKATANANDSINGKRINLRGRGVSLS